MGDAWVLNLCWTWSHSAGDPTARTTLNFLLLRPPAPQSGARGGLRSCGREPPRPARPRPSAPPRPSAGGRYSLDSRVAGGAEALAGAGVAAGSVAALARQLAALAVGAGRAELLAAPAAEAGGTHAGARDGVAQGSILALAPVAAVGAPVVAVTACKTGAGQGGGRPLRGSPWDGGQHRCPNGGLPISALLPPGQEAARAVWVEALAPPNFHRLFAKPLQILYKLRRLFLQGISWSEPSHSNQCFPEAPPLD